MAGPPSLRTTMPPLPGDVQWFPSEIRRLIEAIKKHDHIYNPRSEGFGLREAQNNAWKSVAELVQGGKTDVMCRDKWNCLRGTYRRHVRTELTNNVKRRSGWPWADKMSFIREFVIDKDEFSGLQAVYRMKRNAAETPVVNSRMKKYKPIFPMTKKFAPVSISSEAAGGSTLTFASGLYSGGIIINTNRSGIGIVQPNPSVGIVQPAQPNVTMGIVQPSQSTTTRCTVQTSQANVILTNSTPKMVHFATRKTPNIDLSKVKGEPDPPKPPATTEFVDMDIAVKKELIEEDELHLTEEFDYLPEENTQELPAESEHQHRELNTLAKPKGNFSPKVVQEEEISESNLLFMRSTVGHMRQLSLYDQSVFKLKVQQLLHDMMFPQERRN